MDYEQFKQGVVGGSESAKESINEDRFGPDDLGTDEERKTERLYKEYLDESSGEAARRRSIENARMEQREREAEWRTWAEATGSPLPRDFE
jgi:hypothetical protein